MALTHREIVEISTWARTPAPGVNGEAELDERVVRQVRTARKTRSGTVRWATDAESPCYRHLGAPIDGARFTLTAALMAALCEANHFVIPAEQDDVVFALRGCKPASGSWTMHVDAVELVESVPDHATPQCVIGVWRRSTGTVGVVRGSTVPGADYFKIFVANGAPRMNLLPTGMYKYVVGAHKGKYPGVLKLAQDVRVLRSSDDTVFTRRDRWDEPANVGDNIHPAFRTPELHEVDFDSLGCQTVPGNYKAGGYQGLYAQLLFLAGLPFSKVGSANDGRAYRFVLLTGRDARLAASGTPARRLRVGSSGDAVRALQRALASAGHPTGVDGDFGPGTQGRLIAWQRARSAASGPAAADGLLTPDEAAALGVVA